MSKPGEIQVWGDSASIEIKNVPPGDNFRMIAPGGHSQSLAITTDGKLVLWGKGEVGKGEVPELIGNVLNDSFIDASLTTDLVIAIRADNREIEVHGNFRQPPPAGLSPADVPAHLKKMKVMGVAAGGPHAVVIGLADQLLYQFGPGTAPCPGGKFIKIRARHGYTIGLDDSGNLYGWGAYFAFPGPPVNTGNSFPTFWESNPYFADDVISKTRVAYSEPSWRRDSAEHWFVPGPFVDLAAGVREFGSSGLPHILALRPDGMVVGWGGNSFKQAQAPNGVKFLAIAAGKGYSIGIAKNSELYHWGQGGGPPKNHPDQFQSIGAAVSHAAAVRGKLQFVRALVSPTARA